jgi:hypothetical protein
MKKKFKQCWSTKQTINSTSTKKDPGFILGQAQKYGSLKWLMGS